MSDDLEVQLGKAVKAANGTIARLKELRDRKGMLWAALVEFMLEVKVINSVVGEQDRGERLQDMIGKVASKFVVAVLQQHYSPEEVSGKLDELMADTDAMVDDLIKEIK